MSQLDSHTIFQDIGLWQAMVNPIETLSYTSGNAQVQFHYHLTQKAGIRFLRNPPLIPYWVPTWKNKPNKKTQQEEVIVNALAQLPSCDVAEIHLHPSCGMIAVPGFSSEPRHTRILTLEQQEVLWKQTKPSLQRQIKKGQKQLKIQTCFDAPLVWELHGASLKRQGKNPLYSLDEFSAMLNFLQQKNQGQCYVAYHETTPCAAILIAHDAETAYYLSGGTTDLGQTHGAMSYLLWHAIQAASTKPLRYFDFEGSQHPGIDRFFANFGAKQVPYTLLLKNKSMVFSLYQKVKSWL